METVAYLQDAGREGELIFREIYRYSGSRSCPAPVAAVDDRLGHPSQPRQQRAQDDFQGLADSADCRAESDWLIGMNATRALTVRLRSSRDRMVWSAGRVQTATLAMLVRREMEVLEHELALLGHL